MLGGKRLVSAFGAGIAIAFIVVKLVHAENYKVTVSRIDQDLYRDQTSKVLIETQFCYEFVYFEDAILQWNGPYGRNRLIFDRTTCDVKALR